MQEAVSDHLLRLGLLLTRPPPSDSEAGVVDIPIFQMRRLKPWVVPCPESRQHNLSPRSLQGSWEGSVPLRNAGAPWSPRNQRGTEPSPLSLTSGEAQSPDQGCGLSQFATCQAAKPVPEPRLGCGPRGLVELAQQGKPATAYLESVGRGVDTAWVPSRAPCWAVEADVSREAPSPARC